MLLVAKNNDRFFALAKCKYQNMTINLDFVINLEKHKSSAFDLPIVYLGYLQSSFGRVTGVTIEHYSGFEKISAQLGPQDHSFEYGNADFSLARSKDPRKVLPSIEIKSFLDKDLFTAPIHSIKHCWKTRGSKIKKIDETYRAKASRWEALKIP